MTCLFNAVLSGWIGSDEWNHVQSTYGDNFREVAVTKGGDHPWPNARRCLQNKITKEFFAADSANHVAVKCLMIMIGVPLYTAGRMAFHTMRIPYLIVRVFESCIISFLTDMEKANSNVCVTFFNRFVCELSYNLVVRALLEQVWECIRAPYYGLGVFIAALEGFINDPFKAKTEIALIERHWNWEKTRSHSFHVQLTRNEGGGGLSTTEAYFLAFCMQPVGNENDERYEVTIEDLEPLYPRAPSCPPLIPYPCCF